MEELRIKALDGGCYQINRGEVESHIQGAYDAVGDVLGNLCPGEVMEIFVYRGGNPRTPEMSNQ